MLKRVLCLIGLIALSNVSQATDNLIKNGDFSAVSDNGKIDGWKWAKKANVKEIEGKPTLILNGEYASLRQEIPLQPTWQSLKLSLRMKATDIKVGNAGWKDGRIAMTFKDAKGKRVGNWPKVFHVRGTTGWQDYERDYDVPHGAVSLTFNPAIFGTAGKLEIQDIKLTVAETVKPNSKPVIILKLDDVTSVSKNWKKCADFLRDENVKACFGIIGFALDKNNPSLVKWIKAQHDTGRIEFWNHGYKNRSSKDKHGEFELDSVEEQLKSLQRTQLLAKEKMGLNLKLFGPHWSSTNQATVDALKNIPEIKAVFYYTAGPKRKWYVFKRYLDMEKPIFKPNFEHIKKSYNTWAHKKPYLCLQGHPNAWSSPERFENFKKIVRFFKEKGCTFMTASEYLEKTRKDD